jgi:serine/threonine-protein kinase
MYLRARVRALQGRWDDVSAYLAAPPQPHAQTLYWLVRARLALWRGDRREAAEQLDALPDFPYSEIIRLLYGIIASKQVPEPVAVQMRKRAQATTSKRVQAFYFQINAEMFAYVGNREEALESILASSGQALFDVEWLDHCPLFDGLRDDARFVAARAATEARAAAIRTPLLK